MGRESELGGFKGRGRYRGRGWGRDRGYFNKSSSPSSYEQEEVKFVTRSIKKVYTYTAGKDAILQIVQKSYGYEVESSLMDIE